MKIQEYNAKPKPRFMGKGAWYLGIELEVEAPDQEAYDAGLALRDKPQCLYVKHDGSLENGYEIVTQPIPYERWLGKPRKGSSVWQFLKLIRQLKSMGFSSHASGNCGMHVHVSNSVFGLPDFIHYQAYRERDFMGNSEIRYRRNGKVPYYYNSQGTVPPSFYWFRRLFNDPIMYGISQRHDWRRLQQWAFQMPDYFRKKTGVRFANNYERHSAVNVMTGTTVETRIFRGNMRQSSIRKNVEAVIAAVALSKHLARHNADTDIELAQRFLTYVRDNSTTYPNLARFLRRHDPRYDVPMPDSLRANVHFLGERLENEWQSRTRSRARRQAHYSQMRYSHDGAEPPRTRDFTNPADYERAVLEWRANQATMRNEPTMVYAPRPRGLRLTPDPE